MKPGAAKEEGAARAEVRAAEGVAVDPETETETAAVNYITQSLSGKIM